MKSIIRYYLLLIISLIFVQTALFSQSTDDDMAFYKKSHTAAELKEGDRMPDIPLGMVVNNHTGKTRFSQFRGKLVILDFWTTYCGTCLELMPEMERLQKTFGDSIQIFLVNSEETQNQINERFKNSGFRLPDLPSIVNAKKMYLLFPHPMGNPSHVWIDGKGIIRVRGSQYSTYESKIRDLLAGKVIYNMKDNNSTAIFDKRMPYYQFLAKTNTKQTFCSFFTAHNNEYAALTGGRVEGIKDSAFGTIRNTFVNREATELYAALFKESLLNFSSKVILYNGPQSTLGFSFFVKDTLRYTFGFNALHKDKELMDKDFVKSRVCYEQITPISLTEKERQKCMLEDLNRYFDALYGARGGLEKVKMPCFALVRTTKEDKLATQTKGNNYKIEPITVHGMRFVSYHNRPLKECIASALLQMIANPKNTSTLLLDETEYKNNVDIVLPDEQELGQAPFEKLRKSLIPYGLDIIKTERELEMVVIREKDYQSPK